MEHENLNTEETANSVQTAVRRSVLRYAWGNSTLKTWFITKSNKLLIRTRM